MGPRHFKTFQELLSYNFAPICGLCARWLYGGADGNLLQEDLHHTRSHTRSLPGLLQPLLTRANAGDTQTLKGKSGSVSVGSLGAGAHKVLFEPSSLSISGAYEV